MSCIKRLCRVCMAKEKKEELVPILGDLMSEETATDIFLISGVQIIDFPSCPALICSKCIKDLSIAKSFRNQCISSDQSIRENEEKSSWIKTESIEPNSIKIEVIELESRLDINSPMKIEAFTRDLSESEQEEDNFEDDGCGNMHTSDDPDTLTLSKEDENLTCEICNKTFKQKKLYDLHRKKAHKKYRKKSPKSANIGCHYCLKFYENDISIIKHIKNKHEIGRATCDQCGESFPFKTRLPSHFKTVHKRTIPKQPTGPKGPRKNTKEQKNITKETVALICSVCGRTCKTKSFLRVHEKSHIKFNLDDYLFCDLCGNKFKRKRKLINHINERHILQIRYTCPQCPHKSWARKHHLVRHIKVVHEKIRNFKCEWCGKDFPEKNKLENHIRTHTGEKPFECNFCGRRFMHEADHMRHVWQHKGIRKFKCMSCRNVYGTKEELVAHRSQCDFYSYNQRIKYL